MYWNKIHLTLMMGVFFLFNSINCFSAESYKEKFTKYSEQLLDSTIKYYLRPCGCTFNETYPVDSKAKVTYLQGNDTVTQNRVAYLWPTSGIYSGINAVYRLTKKGKYINFLDDHMIPILDEYYDHERQPAAFQSYVTEAGRSDRYYDDNVWVGIDFVETNLLSHRTFYLEKAMIVWRFLMSGKDNKLGGGIYWVEQNKNSKNTCINAPAAVMALLMYQATKDPQYLNAGRELYAWTQKTLQDPSDLLYWDCIKTDGRIEKNKYAYNSGQMLQAAVLLYKATKEQHYLSDAQKLAKACSNYFFEKSKNKNGRKLLKNGDVWFTNIMLRGFDELYKVDHNTTYLKDFAYNLDELWKTGRSSQGLFADNTFHGKPATNKKTKWLNTEGALIEMYATLAQYDL